MDVGINRTCRHDFSFPSNHFSIHPNNHLLGDARLNIGVSGFSDP
jgi:hypothetical protein